MVKKTTKKEKKIETPLQPTDEENAIVETKRLAEKEARRKMLLDLQATCARERITRLSDIERKLEELDK